MDKQDVLNLILSNLAYAVTGEDDTLEMYAIEKQLKTLSGIMDETMELAASSTGDGKRVQEEMKSLSSQMVVLREQLEMIKGRIDSNGRVTAEIESIKQCLSADSLDFTEYNDVTIRRLVGYICVMKDNSIIIVLKGGMQIQEHIRYGRSLKHSFLASLHIRSKRLEKYDEIWYNIIINYSKEEYCAFLRCNTLQRGSKDCTKNSFNM